jgi:uncharacterized protein (TIGR02246 family)
MRSLWAAAILFGLTLGCRPAPLTEAQQAAILDSVATVVHGLFTSINQRDTAAVLGAYVDDAVMANNGVIYSTRDSYGKALDSVWQALGGVETRTLPLRSRLLRRDLAVTMVPFTLTLTAKTGQRVTGQGVLTALLQRQTGGWRILRSHESELHRDQLLQQVMPGKRR